MYPRKKCAGMGRLLFLLCLCALSFITHAQPSVKDSLYWRGAPYALVSGGSGTATPGSQFQSDILPQSPEAQAMIKSALLPVSLYSGLPQINIPLYDLKTPSLDIPISLSYNFSGFKIAETASSVGLGWNVEGGGVITRIIKSKVDHLDPVVLSDTGDYDDYVNINQLAYKQDFVQKLAQGKIDGEPDLYVFSAPGLTGKFILMQGHAYIFPQQNIQITSNSLGFVITNEKGDRYIFHDKELTHHKQSTQFAESIPDHASAYFLTQIISADLADTINYTYNTYTYHQLPAYSQTLVTRFKAGTYLSGSTIMGSQTLTIMANSDSIYSKQLQSISYKSTIVAFGQDYNLRQDISPEDLDMYPMSGVTVTDQSTLFSKAFVFKHDYFNGRLNLTEVDMPYSDSGTIDSYKFTYSNEDGSIAILDPDAYPVDHWGYYNGANNQILFTANDLSYCTWVYANREPDIKYCRINALSKITYPTGGYANLFYEQNQVMQDDTVAKGPGIRIQEIDTYDGMHNGAILKKQYSYSNGQTYFSDPVSVTNTMQRGSACQTQIFEGDGCPHVAIYDLTSMTLQASLNTPTNDLANNQFFYRNVTETTIGGDSIGRTDYVYNCFAPIDPDVFLQQKTVYGYKNSQFIPLQQSKSIYTKVNPTTFQTITSTLVEQQYPDPPACYGCPLVDVTGTDPSYPSATVVNLYGVIHNQLSVGRKVLQSTIDIAWDMNGQNPVTAETDYYYDNPSHFFPTRTITTNSKGETVTTQMKYPLDYALSTVPTQAMLDSMFGVASVQVINTFNSCDNSLDVALRPYIPYSSSTASGFQSVLNGYSCESDFRTGSLNVFMARNNWWAAYTNSLDSASGATAQPLSKALYWMQASNIISPVIEKYVSVKKSDSVEYLLSAIRNSYSMVGSSSGASVAKSTGIQMTELQAPLAKSTFLGNIEGYYKNEIVKSYDPQMRMVKQAKVNDKKYYYLWGYAHRLVVAQIEGSDSATIAGLYSQSVLDNMNTSPTAMRAELNKVRTGLAGTKALVTSCTYDVLLGVTSKTDPAGRTTYYEYDLLGRLSDIKDLNGNIIKTYQYHLMN